MAAERRLLGPNVAVLFGASQGKYPDGNTVIVCGRDGTLVIDPALSVRDEPETIVVDRVLLTHPHEDHVAGLSAVRHAVVQVHRDDRWSHVARRIDAAVRHPRERLAGDDDDGAGAVPRGGAARCGAIRPR